MQVKLEFLPCPFCGKVVDLDNGDTLYPAGMYWRITDGIKHHIRYKDTQQGDESCWGMHCPETAGGCGAEIEADSKNDAVNKWNRRTNVVDINEGL